MKQTIITSTLLALALTIASCGGGNTTQNYSGAQSADTTATTATTKQVTNEPTKELFAYEILKKIIEDPKVFERIADELENGVGEDCGVPREKWGVMEHLNFITIPDDYDREEGFLDCFPIKTGGYFALFRTLSCGDYEHWGYYPYIYKDGVLYQGDSMLPTPGIKDYYSNSDQFPEDAAEILASAMEYPEYVLENYDDKITLRVRFVPWELDERGGVLPQPLKGFQRKEDAYFPTIEYHWDGEKFARNADSKPREEDLQYFEEIPAEMKSSIVYQVAQKLPLEEFDNQRIKSEYLYEFWHDTFDPPIYSVMCFPYKDGGCLVLTGYHRDYLEEYKAYTFKDGNLTESDFRLPTCPWSELLDAKKFEGLDKELAALEEVYPKTPHLFTVYNISFPEQEVKLSFYRWNSGLPEEVSKKLSDIEVSWQDRPKYKWDGEQFVKQ